MEEAIQSFELTPSEEIASRIAQIQERMREKGIELVLLAQNVDIFYFSGTIQKGYLFIPQAEEAIFFVQKDYDRAILESPLKCVKIESAKVLPNLLKDYGLHGSRVGMELDVVPVSVFNRIHSLFRTWEIQDISLEIKKIRSVKSDFELRQIKKSGEIITRVFGEVKNHLREGMAEIELDAVLTSLGRSFGHQGFLRMRGLNQEMMNIHVLSGKSGGIVSFCDTPLSGYGVTPAIAQGSSNKIIERNQPVVIDYGGGYNGYSTDETRTFVVGRLSPPLEKAYRVALSMFEEVESLGRPGVLPGQVYEKIQGVARGEGLEEQFMGWGEGKVAFIGHGFGLEINELPVLSHGEKRPFRPGMVFAFEPKFVFPGEGAIGVELDYIVRESGLERVTEFSKDTIPVA